MTKYLLAAAVLLWSSYTVAAGRTEPKRCREIVFKTLHSGYKDAVKLNKEFQDLKCPAGPYKPMVDPSLSKDCHELAKQMRTFTIMAGALKNQMIALDCP